MVKFKYRKEQSTTDDVIWRPVADVEFQTRSGGWIDCHPYIDSGADMTLISLSFGKLLGLEIRKEEIKELYGLGKQGVPVIFQRAKMKINKYVFDTLIAWALIEEVPLLLGRCDIFDRFYITFKQDRKTIEFVWKKTDKHFSKLPRS